MSRYRPIAAAVLLGAAALVATAYAALVAAADVMIAQDEVIL